MKPMYWVLLMAAFSAQAMEPENLQRMKVPPPPWPAGDERGMANQIGPATLARCAWHMQQPGSRTYELSHLRSNTMPASPFAGADPGEAESHRGDSRNGACFQQRISQ